MLTTNNTNISTKALRAAKEALANAIEGTATLAGLSGSFRKNLSGKRLQGQKLSLSLPLLKQYYHCYLSFLPGKYFHERNIEIALHMGTCRESGHNDTAEVLCCLSALSARLLSFNTLYHA